MKTITNNCVEMIKHLDFINDNKDNDAYIIFDDYESLEYLDTNGKTIGYEKNTKNIGTVNVIFESDKIKIKKISKKKSSKKLSKKKSSKKLSKKKSSKKLSKKKSSKKLSKITSKKKLSNEYKYSNK
jgi:hypothetical protein